MQADVTGGILMMRAPAGRGLVAIGNAAGQLALADPRTGNSSLGSVIMLAVGPYVFADDRQKGVSKQQENMTLLRCCINRGLGCT